MSIVAAHDNIHIPRESFPSWIWYMIEFAIVLAIALVVGWQISNSMQDIIVGHGFECEQVSATSDCSIDKEITTDESMLNWVFYGISGAIMLLWYVGIRGLILKKPILRNRG